MSQEIQQKPYAMVPAHEFLQEVAFGTVIVKDGKKVMLGNKEDLSSVCDALNAAYAAGQETAWLNLNEHLPEHNEECLVDIGGSYMAVFWDDTRAVWFDPVLNGRSVRWESNAEYCPWWMRIPKRLSNPMSA